MDDLEVGQGGAEINSLSCSDCAAKVISEGRRMDDRDLRACWLTERRKSYKECVMLSLLSRSELLDNVLLLVGEECNVIQNFIIYQIHCITHSLAMLPLCS